MNFESYDGYDEAFDGDYGGEGDYDEVDDMLESMMDPGSDESDQDVTERRRRPQRGRALRPFPKTVPVARGVPPVKAPPTSPYVQQRQFAEALGQVGGDLRRNAMGIKTVNSRLGVLDGRVATVAGYQRGQNQKINKISKQLQLDGALDIAQSFTVDPATNTLNLTSNPAQILQAVVKFGVLGGQTGLLGNPFVVGGIGFLLNSGIVGNILGPRPIP